MSTISLTNVIFYNKYRFMYIQGALETLGITGVTLDTLDL